MNSTKLQIMATAPIDPIIHKGLGSLYPIVTAENDERETLLGLMPNTVCLITRGLAPIDGDIMDVSNDLVVISRTGAGYENLDVEAATERGIPVVYAPLLGDAVAEATFALLLALTKRLFYWHDSLISGRWKAATDRTDDLYGKTIGIIGMGRIGRAVAARAQGFGMRVIGYDPYVDHELLDELQVELKSLDELLGESDVVSLHALVSVETTGMINLSNIRKIKRGAYLLNFGRGALIDGLDILHEALVDEHLSGFGLDVFPEEPPANVNHPLFQHPNFIGSPHVLCSTAGAEARCAQSVVEDLGGVFRGEQPRWCVNPEVFSARNLRKPSGIQ